MGHWKILCLIILLALCGFLSAQPGIKLETGPRQLALDGYLRLQYTIEDASQVTSFVPPDFKNFQVVQGPEQNSGWTLVSGSMKRYLTMTYVLRPRRKGVFTIGAASARADGINLRTDPVTVEVSDLGPLASAQSKQPAIAAGADDYTWRKGETLATKLKGKLFIRLEVTKKSVYVGEPLVATYKLFTRLPSESRVVKRPSLSGFSVSDMVEPESDIPQREYVDGREYNVYVLRKAQLYPLQAGQFVLEPMVVENQVRFLREYSLNGKNDLDALIDFSTRPDPQAWELKTLELESPALTIQVRPLPDKSRPAAFTGAVGLFSLSLSIDKPEIAAGEQVHIQLKIDGHGNIPVVTLPELRLPESMEAFEAQVQEDINRKVSPIHGTKTYTIPVSARDTGWFQIGPVHFWTFDPVRATYHQVQSDSVRMHVTNLSTTSTGTLLSPEQTTAQGPDKPPPNRAWWLSLPLAALLAWLGWRKWRQYQVPKPVLEPLPVPELPDRRVEERLAAQERLRILMQSGQASLFYQETEKILRDLLLSQAGIRSQDPEHMIRYKWKAGQGDEQDLEDLLALLDDCLAAGFSPLVRQEKIADDFEVLERLLAPKTSAGRMDQSMNL